MTPQSPTRQAITASLKERGSITVVQAMKAANCTADTARDCLCRMVRHGVAKVDKTGAVIRYLPAVRDEPSRNVARAHRPTRLNYAPIQVIDPYALPPAFFGTQTKGST